MPELTSPPGAGASAVAGRFERASAAPLVRRVAVVGNHLPRQCGIATFTSHLAAAIAEACPDTDTLVLAVNDPGRSHAYPANVRFEIAETDPASYRRAADYLNVNDVDVVSIQHEFGIFGGRAGSHLLHLLEGLRMPVVATLHTILAKPSTAQRQVIDEIAQRLVVMSAHGSGVLISTPYVYARELLADDRGVLVPARDAAAIGGAVRDLLADDARRCRLRDRAALHGRTMSWPAVATGYRDSFERAVRDHARHARSIGLAAVLARRVQALPEVSLRHVHTMTDDTGLLQHARFSVPNYSEGYCLDDNARALSLMTRLEDAGAEDRADVRALATRYLAFVSAAFDPARGRFRNFLSYARTWPEETGSEDSQGRAVHALGSAVGRATPRGCESLAAQLFHAALPAIRDFTSPRAWATTLLGIEEYLRAYEGDRRVEEMRRLLADRLLAAYAATHTDAWPWFEDNLTYANAQLPHALITSGARMGRSDLVSAGLSALLWLISVQRSEEGHFAPIGSNGFSRRGGRAATFDQQPIEASTMVAACLEAERVTGDAMWGERARSAFDWFLGRNHLRQWLYDTSTGGCRDGLHADRVNENQGAESTLAFLLALVDMRGLDRPQGPRAIAPGRQGIL